MEGAAESTDSHNPLPQESAFETTTGVSFPETRENHNNPQCVAAKKHWCIIRVLN